MLTTGLSHDQHRSGIAVDCLPPQHVGGVRSTGRPHGTKNRGRAVCCWDSLTNTERRVAALVAEGLTNREVAERMFLSRHTVDFHLRRIYLKLHINSRVQLARLVVEQNGAATAHA
jgi:DNA-binding CsgD family transcriptional regulator